MSDGGLALKHDAHFGACPKTRGPSDSVETPVGPPPPNSPLKDDAVGGAESRTRTGLEHTTWLPEHVPSDMLARAGRSGREWQGAIEEGGRV